MFQKEYWNVFLLYISSMKATKIVLEWLKKGDLLVRFEYRTATNQYNIAKIFLKHYGIYETLKAYRRYESRRISSWKGLVFV